MANASEEIPECLDFHPCDAPKGMTFYNLRDLTNEQQQKLNQYKLNTMRENQVYLKNHPEVKVIVQFLLKGILKARPNIKLTQFLGQYLANNWVDLKTATENAIINQSLYSSFTSKGSVEICALQSASRNSKNTISSGLSNATIYSVSVNPSCAKILYEILDAVEANIAKKHPVSYGLIPIV